jgi:uncharacterized membrane protein YcaP (DUF421 family)
VIVLLVLVVALGASGWLGVHTSRVTAQGAISVFALLTIAAAYATKHWTRVRPFVHGVPYVLIRDGEPVTETMRLERVCMDDLLIATRQQGITRFSDIDLAVLETNGRISFTRSGPSDGAAAPPQQLG